MRVHRSTGAQRALYVLVAAFLGLSGCGSDPDSPSAATTPSTSPSASGLRLVAIGDSIPFNSSEDCPDCTSFVDRYAKTVEAATGQHVEVANRSLHTGLTLPELLNDRLEGFREDLTGADIIVVAIAHNSNELGGDQPCGKPLKNDLPDWSALDSRCATAAAARARPPFEKLFATITGWRQGKPTILRTINRYNDWIGGSAIQLTPEQDRKTANLIAEWNRVLCAAAEANAFRCGDVSRAFNGADGLTPAKDLLAADYTHPSDKGNARIAKVLSDLGFKFVD